MLQEGGGLGAGSRMCDSPNTIKYRSNFSMENFSQGGERS